MPVGTVDTWVFGYGSLMWHPGFRFAEARRARLTGYHRAFCVYSIHYRGTARKPGLVLGLDRGGACEGIAFRIPPEAREAALSYLRRRELIYGVYRETLVHLDLVRRAEHEPQTSVWAITYIAERAHPAYAGCLPIAREALMIRRSAGRGGTNLDYLLNTRRHLKSLGISEPRLERLAALTSPLADRCTPGEGNPRRNSALARAWSKHSTHEPLTVRDNRFGFRAKLSRG